MSGLLLSCGEEFKAGSGGIAAGGASGAGGSSAGNGGDGGDGGDGSSEAGQPGAAGASSAMAGSGGSGAGGGGTAGSATTGGSGGQAGGGAAQPDIPRDGLELWFRADAGVEGDDQVSIWRDGSGHRRDALQTAGNYRPRLLPGALSGKPALVFDGSDDFLKLPPLSVSFAAGVSIFVAVQQSDIDACQGYFEASNGSETDDLHFGAHQDSLLFEVAGPWVNDPTYPLLKDAPQIAVGLLEPSALVHIRSNGNGAGEGVAGIPIETTREQVFIGRTLYSSCAPFKGAIGEVLLYSRMVSDTELLDIEGYLQDKWGCCGP